MPAIAFNRFYRYTAFTRLLKTLVEEHPNLLRLESIGKSHEGRDVWLVTATNFASGPDIEKPALWVDGNLHASEVAGSMAALYFINTLVTRYGQDAEVTAALDTRAFYIVPRVNPDGAEWALADKPKIIRSSTRPYPYDEEPVEGLLQEDIDGDGRILTMRIPDPNGAWKTHPDDPRLMVRRDPVEYGRDLLPAAARRAAAQLRRGHHPGPGPQGRAGPEPQLPGGLATGERAARRGSVPGQRTGVAQPGGFHRPAPQPDRRGHLPHLQRRAPAPVRRPRRRRVPAEDLWTYKKIGDQGTKMTGYPNVSCYHEFRYHPKHVTTGGFDTWMYDHLGIFAWTVEIWSPMRQAGIKDYKYIDWFREHPLEDDLKLMKWND